jgi:ribosomal protein S8|tara:strand:+ start:3974 stop:4315 length:342 start_codon:yes stop_codon:yes gene_type:complete
MNFSFLQVLNKITMALRLKRYKLHLKYSKQNVLFLEFLKEKGFIVTITRNSNILSIFLKYDIYLAPVLNSLSVVLKKGHKHRQKRLRSYLKTNYITNLKAYNTNKSRVLARFF